MEDERLTVTVEERAALSEAVMRAEALTEALGIPFEEAARTVARGSALLDETVAAMVVFRPTEVGTREHAEKQIDRLVPEVAAAMEEWLGRDRENWRSSSRAAARLQLLMRSISGYAGDIAAIDSRDRWWGVNARRDD